MTHIRHLLVGALLALVPVAAGAQELPKLRLTPPPLVAEDTGGGAGAFGRGQGSFLSGRTLGSGAQGLMVQFGWPGMSAELLMGQSSNMDVGGELTFNYGFEGNPRINPGIKMQGALRLTLFDQGRLNGGIRLDPGIAMYFRREFTFGITTPVAFVLGLSAGDAVMVSFGADVPMTLLLVPEVRFILPVLFGVGLEYHIDSHLTVSLDTRFGPFVQIGQQTETDFAFRTLAGVGYRF